MRSDRRQGRRSRRRAAADCRKGHHRYGSPKLIGGGMTRQTCFVCGAVSIDITGSEDSTTADISKPRLRRS